MTAAVFPESSPDATAEKADNEASAILAGCIFGKNKGERELAMRALVQQAAVSGGMRVHDEP
jgi:hypothetical protein